MKARIDSQGKILELFPQRNFEKILHPDLVASLIDVPESARLNDFFIEGQVVGPKPSSNHVYRDGQWVLTNEEIKRRDLKAKRKAARQKLKGIGSANSVAALRETVAAIVDYLDIDLDE